MSDFQNEETIELIKNKAQVVIKEELISLRFQNPLLYWVVFEYEKKGGFTRLDLFERICEGYEKACAEEEEEQDRRFQLDEILVKGVFYNSPMSLFDIISEN